MPTEVIITNDPDESTINIHTGSARLYDYVPNSINIHFPSNGGVIEIEQGRFNEALDYLEDIMRAHMPDKYSTAIYHGTLKNKHGIVTTNHIRTYSLCALSEYYKGKLMDINKITREELQKLTVHNLNYVLDRVRKEKEKKNETSCCG